MESITNLNSMVSARVAVYDDLLSAPRVYEIPPASINEYIETLAAKTYEFSTSLGGAIPYTVIREVTENFIHANFREPVISILDKGNTITFADQGPGIDNKEKAQLPGYTSATSEMKSYIRGVGSGLPIVKEYLSFSGGKMVIEDNIKEGTVITITLHPDIIKEESNSNLSASINYEACSSSSQKRISQREDQIMRLFLTYSSVGQSDIKKLLGISLATATRTLQSLEQLGYVRSNDSNKRVLTEKGSLYLKELYSN